MNLEGRLAINLVVNDAAACEVSIASSRPFLASQLLVGKTPEEVLQTLPMVYSVCAMAHGRAAFLALREACGRPDTPELDAAHRFLVEIETVREHSLRMLLDWPGFMAETTSPKSLRDLGQCVIRCRDGFFVGSDPWGWGGGLSQSSDILDQEISRIEALLTGQVFGMPPLEWLSMTSFADLAGWAGTAQTVPARFTARVLRDDLAQVGASQVTFLPELEAEAVHRRIFGDPQFARLPTWHAPSGTLEISTENEPIQALSSTHPCETSSLSRCHSHPLVRATITPCGQGLLGRIVARLVETAQLMALLRKRVDAGVGITSGNSKGAAETVGSAPSDGLGLGQVEAARGRLIHRVEMAHGKVRGYDIIAPTEWNFHPAGVAAQSLLSLKPHSALNWRRQAELVINALDPCVGFDLSTTYA